MKLDVFKIDGSKSGESVSLEKDVFGIQSHHEKEGVFKANEIRR